MAYKIITTVYDAYGNSYPTDVFCKYNLTLNSTFLSNLKLPVQFSWYKDQQHYTDGWENINVLRNSQEKKDFISMEWFDITLEQAAIINLTLVDEIVKAFLESIYGIGNVIEVQ